MHAIFNNYSPWITKVNSPFKYAFFYHTDSNVNTKQLENR
jgi:hypothetical protein